MIVLSKIFRNRLFNATHCCVIAIDRFEAQIIDVLIKYLHESFKTRISYFIRLCLKILVEIMNSNLRNYNRVITH